MSLYDCLLVVYARLALFVISDSLHVFDKAQHLEFKFLHVVDQAQHLGIATSNVNVCSPSRPTAASPRCQGCLCNAAFAPFDVAKQVDDKDA